MADINFVVLIGRLTRNAELKYTNTGTAVSKTGIAVNKKRRKDNQLIDEVSFFDITIWGKMAESLQPYLVKGKQIAVQGELRQSRWEQDGQPRSRIEVVANNLQLLGGKTDVQSGPSTGSQGYMPPDNSGGGPDDFEDDIPF